MKRIYNGKLDPSFRKDIWTLLTVYRVSRQNCLDRIKKDGKCGVIEDYGMPIFFNMASKKVVLSSKEEVDRYLNKEFTNRMELLYKNRKPADFLSKALMDFVLANEWRYPTTDELKDLAIKAEEERLKAEGKVPPVTIEVLASEIIQLSIEIMERARVEPVKGKKEKVFVPVQPYPETFDYAIKGGKYCTRVYVQHEVDGTRHGDLDYSCKININNSAVEKITLRYTLNGKLEIEKETRFNFRRQCWESLTTKELMEVLWSIYDGIIERAKEYQVDFINEITGR